MVAEQCQYWDCSAGALHDAKWYGKTAHGEINREITVMADEQEDKTIYKVVLNHEEQYSIWPAHRENALGWKDAGKSGTKAECLAYIKEVWTDMRPLSLRKKMEEFAKNPPPPPPPPDPNAPPRKSLVDSRST